MVSPILEYMVRYSGHRSIVAGSVSAMHWRQQDEED
jgi:hypothetical protein